MAQRQHTVYLSVVNGCNYIKYIQYIHNFRDKILLQTESITK